MRKYYEKNFMPINLTTLKKKKGKKGNHLVVTW